MTLLSIHAGTDWAYSFPVTVDGQSVDLTGWNVLGVVLVNRLFPNDFTLLYQWAPNLDNVDLSNSAVTISVPKADSLSWEWYVGDFILFLIDPDGYAGLLDEGRVWVEPGVATP